MTDRPLSPHDESHRRAPMEAFDLDRLDDGLAADAQPQRTIDDVDADLPPPPTPRDLERGIDRLDDGLEAARSTDTRGTSTATDTRARAAAAAIDTREARARRDAAERARIREIVDRVRVRAAPPAPVTSGWRIALGVAGFVAMMSLGGAAAALLFVDRVLRVVRGLS